MQNYDHTSTRLRFVPLSRAKVLAIVWITVCTAILSVGNLYADDTTKVSNEGKTESRNWSAIESDFLAPPNAYRLIQYSAHEGAPIPVDKMLDAGIGGVNLFMQKSGYLRTEKAWTTTLDNIHAIKNAGMQLWMADDNGYPSAMAGGLVVKADPSFEVRCLTPITKKGNGLEKERIRRPRRIEKFVSATIYPLQDGQPVLDKGQLVSVSPDLVETNGMEGPWILYAFGQQVNDEGTQASQTASGFDTTGKYPNLLNAAAMEKFVDLTHEEYRRRLGPQLEMIDVFYSNEPNLMSLWFEFKAGSARPYSAAFVPWDNDLPRQFKEQHDYDIAPSLAALFGGDSDEAKLTRRHFYQTVASILAKNYSGRIAHWADRNGVRSAGHPLLEESMLQHVIGYGDFFKFLGEMQVPACDIGMPDRDEYWNYWMPKFLTSIGQIHDRTTVSALLDPLINRRTPNMEPSPEDMRRIVNMAFLCGINQITTYIAWDKYDPAVYRQFCEYVGRMSVLLRGARSAAKTALYYPIETFQAGFVPSISTWDRNLWPAEWLKLESLIATQDSIVVSLIKFGQDFIWLDGETIRNATVREGRLIIGDQEYASIIMPEIELLPGPVMEKLNEFKKSGGHIFWVKSLPRLGDAPGEHQAVRDFVKSEHVMDVPDVVNALNSISTDDFQLGGTGIKDFYIARFVREGKQLNYIVNNSAETIRFKLAVKQQDDETIKVFDPFSGTIKEQKLADVLTLKPCTSLVIIKEP